MNAVGTIGRSVALTLVLLSSAAQAVSIEWSNAGGGSFGSGANWSGGTVPGVNDSAEFLLDATYAVGFAGLTPTNMQAVVDAGQVTFDLTPNISGDTSYTLDFTAFGDEVLMVANMADSDANLTLSSTGDSGVFIPSGHSIIANATGSSGGLTVDNVTFDGGTLTVGNAGSGTLTIQNGSALELADSLATGFENTIANLSGSTGTVVIDNADVISTGSSGFRTITVGNEGDGTLIVQNSATVTNTGATLGNSPGSNGTVTIDNASWTNPNEQIIVGNEGEGSLTLQNGASLTTFQGILGGLSGGTGTATVDASTWTTVGSMVLASSTIDPANSSRMGSLTIQNGATVTIGDVGFFGNNAAAGSSGTVMVDNASLVNDNRLLVGNLGDGSMTIQNGATVSGRLFQVGVGGGTTGIVTVDDSQLTNSSVLAVGLNGNAILNIQNGATVSNTFGFIADGPGSSGTVTVDSATWNNSSSLIVGQAGNGTLHIVNGAVVTSAGGTIGNEDINGNLGFGMVTVNDASWTNNGELVVGSAGTGSLVVQNNASVGATSVTVGEAVGTLSLQGAELLLAGTGDLVNNGVVESLLGDNSVDGNLVSGLSGRLLFEIAGTGGVNIGAITLSGDATLDGTLEVVPLGGFTPALGDSFDLLFAQEITGGFTDTQLPSLAPGLFYEVQVLADEFATTDVLRLSVAVIPEPTAAWLFASGVCFLLLGSRRTKAD